MKLKDLLRSDFKHFRFLVSRNEIKKGDTFNCSTKEGDIYFYFIVECGGVGDNWDIGCNVELSIYTAKSVCNAIEKSKLFIFDSLEHQDDTLYIHLKLNRRIIYDKRRINEI